MHLDRWKPHSVSIERRLTIIIKFTTSDKETTRFCRPSFIYNQTKKIHSILSVKSSNTSLTEHTRFEKTKNLSVSFNEETVKDVSTTSMKQSDEISMIEAPSEETIQTDVKSSPTMNESISSAIPLPLVSDSPFLPRKRPNNVRNGILLAYNFCCKSINKILSLKQQLETIQHWHIGNVSLYAIRVQ